MGIAQVPQRLKNTLNHPLSRFIFVAAIAYTATKDLEISIVTNYYSLINVFIKNKRRTKTSWIFMVN